MPCDRVRLPGGGTAIVCSSRKRKRCECGRPATLLCDWKIGDGKTCDAPICTICAEHVGPDKHLCRKHSEAYAFWRSRKNGMGA